MKYRVILFAALPATLCEVSAVDAATADGKWSVSAYVGDSFSSTGTLDPARMLTLANPAALDPKLAGAPATVKLTKLDYDKAYNDGVTAGIELGYAPGENIQFFGRLNYAERRGRTRELGTLSSAKLAAAEPIRARFKDADSQSLEFGARYFWLADSTWRPYAGVALGAAFTDRMKASLTVPNTAINLKDVLFARRETGFSQSAELGVEYNPNGRFGVRLSGRAEHVSRPSRNADPEMTALGFDFGQHVDSRTSFPVTLAGVYRF